jgi:hypothetical protein
MIEMRVVLHENRINPEIQYRYRNQFPPGCIPDPFTKEWSDWKTAEWVKAEDT